MTNRLDHEAIGGGRRGRPEDRTRRSFQDFGMAEKESICFELLILSTPIRGPSFIVRQVGAGTMYLIRFSQLQALSPVHLAQRQLAPPEGGRRGVAVSVLMEAEHAPWNNYIGKVRIDQVLKLTREPPRLTASKFVELYVPGPGR